MKISPESVVGTFISSFVTDLLTGNVEGAAKPFSLESHCSTLTHVAHSGDALFAHTGAHIVPSLESLSEHFAGSTGAEVTQLSAVDVAFGVHGTAIVQISTQSAVHVVQMVVLLENFDDESYFARALTLTILHVENVEVPAPVAAPVEEPVAVPESAPEEEVIAPVVVEEPAVVKPKKGKGKGKKTGEETAAAVAAPAPVEEIAAPVVEVSAPVEEVAVVATAPVVAVEEPVAPAAAAPVVERRVESPAPTASKSWATLAAAKPVPAPKAAAPVRVASRAKEEVAAVEAPVETKKANVRSAPAPRHDAAGDKLVFTVQSPVTDEQVISALGKWGKNIVSLRNVSQGHQRVFVDFSVEGVLEEIKEKITIGGQKTPVFRQKPKE